jgi:hypothetical protein
VDRIRRWGKGLGFAKLRKQGKGKKQQQPEQPDQPEPPDTIKSFFPKDVGPHDSDSGPPTAVDDASDRIQNTMNRLAAEEERSPNTGRGTSVLRLFNSETPDHYYDQLSDFEAVSRAVQDHNEKYDQRLNPPMEKEHVQMWGGQILTGSVIELGERRHAAHIGQGKWEILDRDIHDYVLGERSEQGVFRGVSPANTHSAGLGASTSRSTTPPQQGGYGR